MSPPPGQAQQACQGQSRNHNQSPSTGPAHSRNLAQTSPWGLPEYLYYSYERIVDVEQSSEDIPLLTEAKTEREISYQLFQHLARVLASNLAARHSVTRDSIIAIMPSSTVDIPVICAAAWLLCASVVALDPSTNLQLDDLVQRLGALRQMPRTFFASRSMLPVIQQAVNASAHQQRQWGRFEQPNVVVLRSQASPVAIQDEDFSLKIWTIDELYISPLDEPPFQRPNLAHEQTRELTAIIYFHYYTDENGLAQIQTNEMSHANVIGMYQASMRDSPSTPIPRRYFRMPGSRDSSMSRGLIDGRYEAESGLETAYTIFRLHRAYRLHNTVMNIFCRGAMYVVSPSFQPDEFAHVIGRYGLQMAELTYSEIKSLVEHISNQSQNQRPPPAAAATTASSIDLLKCLRFIYTESENAASEFGPHLHAQLPDIKIVRTRYGSYVEPLA